MVFRFPIPIGLWVVSLILCRFAHGLQIDSKLDDSMQQDAISGLMYKMVKGIGLLSDKYLIATFPETNNLVYSHLPDNVWRPMLLGKIEQLGTIAVDQFEHWLYVSDPGAGKIWRYSIVPQGDGSLKLSWTRHLVTQGYIARWMSVDFTGDLYFTGTKQDSNNSISSIFRQDKSRRHAEPAKLENKIILEDNSDKIEVMETQSASDVTGVATDTFNVYWGRNGDGGTSGSICKGTHMNSGINKADMKITPLFSADYEVRGLTVTGNDIFFVSDAGVHLINKNSKTQTDRIVATAPGNRPWKPKSIVWDVDNTVYLTDNKNGAVYFISATNTKLHNLTKFNDAPGIDTIAIFQSSAMQGHMAFLPAAMVAITMIFTSQL